MIPGNLYCGTHTRAEGKLLLPEYIRMVEDKFKNEILSNLFLYF